MLSQRLVARFLTELAMWLVKSRYKAAIYSSTAKHDSKIIAASGFSTIGGWGALPFQGNGKQHG